LAKEIKRPLTDYGKNVRTKLIELNKSQQWLISRIAEKTKMFVDSSLLNKILTGQKNSERIVSAINSILDDCGELSSSEQEGR